MKKHIKFLLFLFIINCKKESTKVIHQYDEIVSIEILNIKYYKNNIYKVQCKITNLTNDKFFFPLDNNFTRFFSYVQDKINQNYYYALFYDVNDKIIYASLYNNGINLKKNNLKTGDSLKKIRDNFINDSLISKNYTDLYSTIQHAKYLNIKKNGFYLYPKSVDTITIETNTNISTKRSVLTESGYTYYEPYKLIGSKLQIVINIDSIYTNDLLSSKDFDSLRKNNIKIFHGTIYSNKVPLVVE